MKRLITELFCFKRTVDNKKGYVEVEIGPAWIILAVLFVVTLYSYGKP